MQLKDQAAIVTGGASLALHMIDNPYLNGEVVRLDAALRMSPR